MAVLRRLLLATLLTLLATPALAAADGPDVGITVTDPSVVNGKTVYDGERGRWSWVRDAEYRVRVSGDNGGETGRGVAVRARGTGIDAETVQVGTLRPADDFQVELPVTLEAARATMVVEVRNRRNRLLDRRVVSLTEAPAPAPPAAGRWEGVATDALGNPVQPARSVAFRVADGGFADLTAQLAGEALVCSDEQRTPTTYAYPDMRLPRSNVFGRSGVVRRDDERLRRDVSLRFLDPTTAVGSYVVTRTTDVGCPVSVAFTARWVGP